MNQEIEQLKEAIKAAEKKIQELESIKAVDEWPEIGDIYYAIDFGESTAYTFENDRVDNQFKAIGNIFKTQEEANAQLEALKVCHELRSQPGSKKFESRASNFYAYVGLDDESISWGVSYYGPSSFTQAYFDSEESCQAAINKVGKDRIIKSARWLAMGEV